MYGTCCTRSGGISVRWALYPPYSTSLKVWVLMSNLRTEVTAFACSSRNVGPATSKTAARYSGLKSARSLRSMFTKTKVGVVGAKDEGHGVHEKDTALLGGLGVGGQ